MRVYYILFFAILPFVFLEGDNSTTPKVIGQEIDMRRILPKEAYGYNLKEGQRPQCENCTKPAQFYIHFSDGSGGRDCVDHGETLEEKSISFRVSLIKGKNHNGVAGNAIFSYINNDWTPLNFLTLQPIKSEEIIFSSLHTPYGKSLYSLIKIAQDDEIRIELEQFQRKDLEERKLFRQDENPHAIQTYREICRITRNILLEAINDSKHKHPYWQLVEKLPDPYEDSRVLYQLANEITEGTLGLALEDYLRMKNQEVKSLLNGLDPDLQEKMDQAKSKMRSLLKQGLNQGMEYIDRIQIQAVVHELPITNNDIRRWAKQAQSKS